MDRKGSSRNSCRAGWGISARRAARPVTSRLTAWLCTQDHRHHQLPYGYGTICIKATVKTITESFHTDSNFCIPSLQQYTPILPFSFTHTYQTSCTLGSSILHHHFNSTLLSYLSASLTHIKHHAPSDHLFRTIISTAHSCLTFQLCAYISDIMHALIIKREAPENS